MQPLYPKLAAADGILLASPIYTFESLCRFPGGQILAIVHGSLNDVGDAQKHPELLEQAYQLGQRLGEKTTGRPNGPP